MFCTKCGKQIPDSTKFCPYCGANNRTVKGRVSTCEFCGQKI